MKTRPHGAEFTTLSVRTDVAAAIRRAAELERRPVYEIVQRSFYAYRRWRAEQSYIDDRPDMADPATDGIVSPPLIQLPLTAPNPEKETQT
jgi:hypothetical protein